MLTIKLINMPFASYSTPSIGLTQLQARLEEELGERVECRVHYLNQQVARFLGTGIYRQIGTAIEHQTSGMGDWIFRQQAFPDLPDDSQAYLRRFYPRPGRRLQQSLHTIRSKRREIGDLIEELIDEHRLDEADLVGFTSMFAQNVPSFALARRLKQRRPSILTVMGGANCEPPMGQEISANVPWIDYVFLGPALKSFPRFVKLLLEGCPQRWPEIAGICARRASNGASEATPGLGEELAIDSWIELDYEPFFEALEKNFPEGGLAPSLYFETSRGCWWGERAHCTFCGLNATAMKYRSMSPSNALRQIRSLFRYASRCPRLTLFSVDNIMPKSYLKEVFPRLQPPSNLELFYEVKSDLTRQDLEVLSRAGVRRVQPGIEALSSYTLKLMRKGITSFRNLVLLKDCLVCGIEPEWNLLAGFPGEEAGIQQEVYRNYLLCIPLLTHLPPPSGTYPVRFDRYSPYFTQADHYGLELEPFDFYSFIYPFPRRSLANLAYYFSDRKAGSADYFRMKAVWFGRLQQAVEDWKRRWEAGLRPELRLKKRGAVVCDTRSGELVEHRLSEEGVRLLHRLRKPVRVGVGEDEGGVLAGLAERGLVFEEGGRYLSLVVEEEGEGEKRLTA